MRKFGISILLMAKRLVKRPVYPVLLLLMPVVTLALSGLQEHDRGGVRVLLCLADGTDTAEAAELADGTDTADTAELADGTDTAAQRVARELVENERESVISFAYADSEEQLRQAVLKQEADCGYVLPANLGELLQNGDWKRSVQLYCGRDDAIASLVNELLCTAVFREYSGQSYTDYAGEAFAEAAGGAQNAAKQAGELLNLHLTDGSTFRFTYFGGPQSVTGKSGVEASGETVGRIAAEEADADRLSVGVVPVRGMLALFIMLCGFCGLVDDCRDREAGRLVWVKNRAVRRVQMIMVPAGGAAAVSLCCLAAVGQMGGMAREITNVIIYILLLTAYVMLWGLIFCSEHAVVASMPFLIIGAVLFSPIFWNLKAVLPVFGALEKLFPVSWYLGMQAGW